MATVVASPDAVTAARVAVTVASHHSRGSLSAQPGCGVRTGYGAEVDARVRPSIPSITTFTELVPRSIPSKAGRPPAAHAMATSSRTAHRRCRGISDHLDNG